MKQQENQPLQSNPSIQQEKKIKTYLFVFVSVLLTGILVGGGVFLWQQNNYKKKMDKLENEKVKLLEQVRSENAKLLEKVRRENAILKDRLKNLEKIASEAASEREEIERKTCKGFWKEGVCVKATCVDSDVNEKPDDIFIKGSVTYTDENGVETVVYDECTGSKTQLNEMWCYESPSGSGNYVPGRKIYDCPNGCLDGACIK